MANGNEVLFMQTDLLFDFALNVVNELRRTQRLNIVYFQEAFLNRIQSNNPDSNLTDCFGARPGTQGPQRRTAFSGGMCCVLRHLMLNATGIPENAWPVAHRPGRQNLQLQRNHGTMQVNFDHPPPNHFRLALNERDAQHYYGAYDHQFPMYQMQNKLADVQVGHLAQITGDMLVFRFNTSGRLSQIIDIITTGGAVEDPNDHWRMARSYARVICIVHRVSDGVDGEWMKTLKTILPQRAAADENQNPRSTLDIYGRIIPEDPGELCDISKLGEAFGGLSAGNDDDDDDA